MSAPKRARDRVFLHPGDKALRRDRWERHKSTTCVCGHGKGAHEGRSGECAAWTQDELGFDSLSCVCRRYERAYTKVRRSLQAEDEDEQQ